MFWAVDLHRNNGPDCRHQTGTTTHTKVRERMSPSQTGNSASFTSYARSGHRCALSGSKHERTIRDWCTGNTVSSATRERRRPSSCASKRVTTLDRHSPRRDQRFCLHHPCGLHRHNQQARSTNSACHDNGTPDLMSRPPTACSRSDAPWRISWETDSSRASSPCLTDDMSHYAPRDASPGHRILAGFSVSSRGSKASQASLMSTVAFADDLRLVHPARSPLYRTANL